ncbi:MAG: T9SS type A sorting domain-containing protein [Bacteroidia bacterium]|nr:T9SS type A sorting domain-containing protein [Bacteroidia bacterium]
MNKKWNLVRTGIVCMAVCCMADSAVAQLLQRPLPRSNVSAKVTGTSRTEDIVLSLPFWDDFSTNNTGVADPDLWQNSNSVWINAGVGIKPPTLNVATFDGLDSVGAVYDSVNINGYRDKLVSNPIDLSTLTPAEQSTVYLSFFYQWKGNGEPPDGSDYLQLQFRNATGQWDEVIQIKDNNFVDSVFYYYSVKVEGTDYLHDAFQFRLRSYGRLTGAFDTWNVDYVYMNKNRGTGVQDFPDRAAAMPIGPLFGQYYHIPLGHFRETKALYQPTLEVRSLRNLETTIDFDTYGTFVNVDTATNTTTVYTTTLGTNRPIKGASSGLEKLEYVNTLVFDIPDPDDAAQFMPDADSIAVTLRVELETKDNSPIPTGDYDPAIYTPIDFRVNDTLQATYVLFDHYAYDDGTAEYTAELAQPGNRAAVQFDMLTTNIDTLIGFDIYVPDAYLKTSVTADFYIYADNTGVPGTLLVSIPSRTISKQGKFQRILFQPAQLVKDRFYVAWREPGAGLLKVGLDKNNNSGDRIFVNANGSWIQNTDVVTGSLMIRPVFGTGAPEVITGIDDDEKPLRFYPNPTRGTFYVQGKYNVLQLLDVAGREVAMATEVEDEHTTKVTVRDARAGMYLLKWAAGRKRGVQKIIVSE